MPDVPELSDTEVGKATSIARNYLEVNFGNLGMLLFRVEQVAPNGVEGQINVLCSLLNSIGSNKRLHYMIKVNVTEGKIVDVYRGEEDKDDPNKINLKKIVIQE